MIIMHVVKSVTRVGYIDIFCLLETLAISLICRFIDDTNWNIGLSIDHIIPVIDLIFYLLYE